MKLVDILARELKVWPHSGNALGQAADTTLHLNDGASHGGEFYGWTKEKFTRAEDHHEAFVTRTQWQAAVDALKAGENAVPEWTGEDLPPAGIQCEVMGGGLPSTAFDWEHCTILLINEGADGKSQVCTRDFRGDLAIYYPEIDAVYFRPIRTPEQIES